MIVLLWCLCLWYLDCHFSMQWFMSDRCIFLYNYLLVIVIPLNLCHLHYDDNQDTISRSTDPALSISAIWITTIFKIKRYICSGLSHSLTYLKIILRHCQLFLSLNFLAYNSILYYCRFFCCHLKIIMVSEALICIATVTFIVSFLPSLPCCFVIH